MQFRLFSFALIILNCMDYSHCQGNRWRRSKRGGSYSAGGAWARGAGRLAHARPGSRGSGAGRRPPPSLWHTPAPHYLQNPVFSVLRRRGERERDGRPVGAPGSVVRSLPTFRAAPRLPNSCLSVSFLIWHPVFFLLSVSLVPFTTSPAPHLSLPSPTHLRPKPSPQIALDTT